MDERLVEAYRRTDYRVRLAGGGHASIRIDHFLPVQLRTLSVDASWGLITAWNPLSRQTKTAINRAAQRRLLADLQSMIHTRGIVPAVGVGADGWFERSLFVIGPSAQAFPQLCRAYRQHACLVGSAEMPARLCWAENGT